MSDVPTPLVFAPAPEAPETFNVLLWGHPKSGKSTAAATAPGPIMWVNAEGPGALGFARKVAAERGHDIHEIVIEKKARNASALLDAIWLHLRNGNDPKPRTVVVDTLAKLRDALIAELVTGGSNTLKQYGEVADKLGGFITALRDMPINLVLLAHADKSDSDEDGRLLLPLIGGALTEKIPGEVDVVAYTAKIDDEDTGTRYVGQLVDGKGRTGLGDRSGALAADGAFRDLDLTEWLEVYREGLTPEAPADIPFLQPESDEDDNPDADGEQQTLTEAA